MPNYLKMMEHPMSMLDFFKGQRPGHCFSVQLESGLKHGSL